MRDSGSQSANPTHKNCRKILSMGYQRALQGFMLVLFCMINNLSIAHAEEIDSQPKPLLDQIWTYLPPPKRVLSKQDQEYAEAALIQWLEAYLHRDYDVIDTRFYWNDKIFSGWALIGNGHASYINGENSQWHGESINQPWHEPGLDLVRVWKVSIDGTDHYFAVAMTDHPVPGTRGRRLIGRFELKKVD